MRHEMLHGDAYEELAHLADQSFDAVILDPPYGMGLDAWDEKLSPERIAYITEHVQRIGKEFYAVFGQMPYLREWDRQAENAGLHFLEHVTWVKRNMTPSARLGRTHEEIYIYAIGQRRQFYQTKGRYEDVKVPGILFDIITIEGIKRHIADLHGQLAGTTTGIMKAATKRHLQYKRYHKASARAPALVNYSNAWSFLPESQKTFNQGGKFHPTMKPVQLVMRLVELLTPAQGSVLDCFAGSGTTAIACHRLGREFCCIERDRNYYDRAVARLAADTWQPELDLRPPAIQQKIE